MDILLIIWTLSAPHLPSIVFERCSSTDTRPLGLLGQALDGVQAEQEGTGRAEPAKPAGVDLENLARAVQPRQRPVDGQAKGRIPATEHQRIRLIGEVPVGQRKPRRVRRCQRQPNQDDAIGGVGVGGLVLKRCEPLCMIGDGEELDRRAALRHCSLEHLLRRRAGDHGDAEAAEIGPHEAPLPGSAGSHR